MLHRLLRHQVRQVSLSSLSLSLSWIQCAATEPGPEFRTIGIVFTVIAISLQYPYPQQQCRQGIQQHI